MPPMTRATAVELIALTSEITRLSKYKRDSAAANRAASPTTSLDPHECTVALQGTFPVCRSAALLLTVAVALAINGRAANAEPVAPAQVAAAVAAATGANEDSAGPVETPSSSPPPPPTPPAETAAPADAPLTTPGRPLYVPDVPTTPAVPSTAVQQQQQPTAAVDGGPPDDGGGHLQKVSARAPVRPSNGGHYSGGGGEGMADPNENPWTGVVKLPTRIRNAKTSSITVTISYIQIRYRY